MEEVDCNKLRPLYRVVPITRQDLNVTAVYLVTMVTPPWAPRRTASSVPVPYPALTGLCVRLSAIISNIKTHISTNHTDGVFGSVSAPPVSWRILGACHVTDVRRDTLAAAVRSKKHTLLLSSLLSFLLSSSHLSFSLQVCKWFLWRPSGSGRAV